MMASLRARPEGCKLVCRMNPNASQDFGPDRGSSSDPAVPPRQGSAAPWPEAGQEHWKLVAGQAWGLQVAWMTEKGIFCSQDVEKS